MLWYRAWCETRARVAIAAVALLAATALVWHSDWRVTGHGLSFASYVWSAAYNDSVKALFVLLAIVLGTGSLRQEQALGTAGFTLALPVRRWRILAVRAGIGLVELFALAAAVAIAVSVLSRAAGDGWPVAQALRYGVQWTACAGLVLACALLASIAIANEYVGWLITFLGFLAYEGAVGVTGLWRYPACDLYRLMSAGADLPWAALALVIAATGGVLAIGHLRLRARDF